MSLPLYQACVSWVPLALSPEDDSLDGIEEINHYAMFMGYVSKAIRGLRYLVLTWTTVVLLGGFVSLLEKKDLWALTVITLVQTAGVFNVSPKQRLKNIRDSFMGLLVSMFHGEAAGWGTVVTLVAATLLQVLFVSILLFPLGAVYVFGLYISTGISLWRLMQRDYGAADGDPSKANMTPALDILYVLPLVQGLLLWYRAIFSVTKRENAVVNRVLTRYQFDGDAGRGVWDYLKETMAGCEKDPSFARGRNLITYAVDLMASSEHASYLSGSRILDTLLGRIWYGPADVADADREQRPRLCNIVAKVLLESASGTQLIWKLLKTLGSRSEYDETARERAGRILEHLASYLHLEQFPGSVQCIVAPQLVEIETYDVIRPRREMVQRMRILQRLAVNSANHGAIIGIPRLLFHITELLHLHRGRHDVLSVEVALESLVLIRRFLDGHHEEFPFDGKGEILEALRNTVSRVIQPTESILMCAECDDSLQREAVNFLARLIPARDDAEEYGKERYALVDRAKVVATLGNVFARGGKNYIRELAGEKLATVSSVSDPLNRMMADEIDGFIARLTGIIVDDREYGCRIQAARILNNIFRLGYDWSSRRRLKEALVHAVPKVLRVILDIQMELQAVADTWGDRFSSTGTDSTEGRAPQDVVGASPNPQQQALLSALLSECVTWCDKLVGWVGYDQDMDLRLDDIAAEVCSKAGQPVRNWVDLVRQAGEIIKDPSFSRERSLVTIYRQ